jgi:UDP-galactopyranose mutase
MINNIDVIIVGAGPAGIVCAEILASEGKKVFLIERRQNIGGHCYDYLNDRGIYVHKYGPHIFHTENKKVWDYLSQFTRWYYYQHKVLGMVSGKKVPIPVNLNTLNTLLPHSLAERLEEKLILEFGYNSRISILELKETPDKDLRFLANFIYNKVFLNYTKKQWGKDLSELDRKISARVPVVISRDDRYFHDRYQGIPLRGYTNLFLRMLDKPNIHLLLNTDSSDVLTVRDGEKHVFGQKFNGHVIYTGMIDELFHYSDGELPYRSERIQFEYYEKIFFQERACVNYPDDYDFTRITEFKHFQPDGGKIPGTTVCREYPEPFVKGKNNPYYVIESQDNQQVYRLYKNKVQSYPRLHVVGRLAHYKYYDLDEVIDEAILLSETVLKNWEK